MRLGRLGLLLPTILSGCGSSESLPPPEGLLGDFALVATAQEGDGALPSTTRIERLDVESPDVSPIAIGGERDIDLLVGELRTVDLPLGLTPLDLEIVDVTAPNARPLPPLYTPHILEEPSPFGELAELIPVGASTGNRATRRDRIVENLAVRDPCVDPSVPFTVVTPRTSSEGINTMRTLSSGDTFIGLSVLSTVSVGLLAAGSTEMQIFNVDTGTTALLLEGERFELTALGATEVQTQDGLRPSEYGGHSVDGFGRIARVARFEGDRYVEQPLFGAAARTISTIETLDLNGTPSICALGGVQGSQRDAGMWCRPLSGGRFENDALMPQKIQLTSAIQGGGNVFVVDAPGNVYRRRGPFAYDLLAEFTANIGCSTPCVSLFARSDAEGQALLAGDDANTLVVDVRSGTLDSDAVPGLSDALFVDERNTNPETALTFSATTIAPDGALWMAAVGPRLFRIAGGEVERVCLPKEIDETPITALEAHPDGRLIVGTTPAFFAFSDWRR